MKEKTFRRDEFNSMASLITLDGIFLFLGAFFSKGGGV